MPTRPLFLLTGWLFVGLATVGVALPLVPTTPFLIVAAACFARSSERFHRWLLANRAFGPLLRAWAETRSIPRRAKVLSVLLIAVVGTLTEVYALNAPWPRALFAGTLLLVVAWLLSRPTTEDL
jgi:uncharacterized membrane protein YbaN (DUF454 family)